MGVERSKRDPATIHRAVPVWVSVLRKTACETEHLCLLKGLVPVWVPVWRKREEATGTKQCGKQKTGPEIGTGTLKLMKGCAAA